MYQTRELAVSKLFADEGQQGQEASDETNDANASQMAQFRLVGIMEQLEHGIFLISFTL